MRKRRKRIRVLTPEERIINVLSKLYDGVSTSYIRRAYWQCECDIARTKMLINLKSQNQ